MAIRIDNLNPGALIGRYRLEECVGRGGNAEVWKATKSETVDPIALKIMRAQHLEDYVRFRQEAEVQQQLRHPHIVGVHGLRIVDGYALIELEFVQGPTLLQWLTRRRPTTQLCDSWVLQILDGLSAAHHQGFIHRDVKPSNILIDESYDPPIAKLADFGIARHQHEPSAEITTQGLVLGTPGYMAPEQVRGQTDIDIRVDLFALGSLAYRLLSGRPTFGGGSHYDVLTRTCLGQYTPLRELNPDLPDRFLETVEAALSIHRADRPDSAQAFRLLWTGRVQREVSSSPETLTLSLEDLPKESVESSSMVQTNRRLHQDQFYGRSLELEKLTQCLVDPNTRVVTLKGPGGVGKTRLADEYLAGLNGSLWPGGIWRSNLTSARNEADLVEALRAVFELRLPSVDPISDLAQSLQKRGLCILLLDNLEQIIEPSVSLIERITDAAPDLRILTTSRIPLGIRGEQLIELTAIESTSAIDLFIDRARTARPNFSPTDEHLNTIASIVERLEHLPLALELAASRLRILSLEQLQRRLEEGTRILQQKRRGEEARHSSLRQAIEWSWELLKPWEQLALAQCSVFRGGFTLDAIDEVLCLDAFEASPWAIDVIESLVDQSLLRLECGADGVQRFDMYLSIREYAASQMEADGAVLSPRDESLTGPGPHREQQQRHARYYSRFGIEEEYNQLRGPLGASYLKAMVREFPNFHAVRRFTRQGSEPESGEYHGQSALIIALVLQRTGQTRKAIPILEEARDITKIGSDLWAQIGANLGVYYRQIGQMESAIETIGSTLRAITPDGLAVRQTKLLQHLGNMARQQGDFDQAQARLDQALRIAQQAKLPPLVAQITGDLGTVAMVEGRLARAQALFEQAVQLHLECQRPDSANLSRANLAQLAQRQGRLQDALALFSQCVNAARSRGNRRQEMVCLGYIGELELSLHHYPEAESAFKEAMKLNEGMGDRRRESVYVGGLGQIQLMLNHHEQALPLLEKSLQLAEGVDPNRTSHAHGLLAMLASRQHRSDDADAHLTAAEPFAERAGPAAILQLAMNRVEVAISLQRRDQALEHLSSLRQTLNSNEPRWFQGLQVQVAELERRVMALERADVRGGLLPNQRE